MTSNPYESPASESSTELPRQKRSPLQIVLLVIFAIFALRFLYHFLIPQIR